ncbi:MAG: diheme cytochrome c-553 [Chitinophagaceae bacterium]|nr:diheme cytochrome c-553 [Chitinophagaceae bacterium]
MKKIFGMLLAFSGIIIYSCNNNQTPVSEPGTNLTKDSLIKRGEYLVTAIGCGDCHSPKKMSPQGPVPDHDLMLSGHPSSMPLPVIDTAAAKNWLLFAQGLTASVGPWGTSYAANITSDETGIGKWTEAQFFTAIRQGKSKGMVSGRDLLPPMPWQNFATLTDTDLKSIYYFLMSTKPISNVVPAPAPPPGILGMR